jgi:heme/copper-type cytochrome/quinol oxidase subunit 4
MSAGSRFCHRCGAALPPGAAFCASCGTAVAVAPSTGQVGAPTAGQQGVTAVPPSYPMRHERYEKHEKQEKHEKHEKHEKGRGGDLAGALTGGLVLILLGVLLYFAAVGNTAINYSNFWEYFLIGIGVILILQGLIRYAERGTPYLGSFIGGAVLILIGFAFVSSQNYPFWPLILIILGLAAIASAFSARRRVPVP